MGRLFNRSQITFLLGVVLVAVGLAVALAVRAVSFSRYMHLEDLGLDVDPALGAEVFSQIVAPTMTERTIFYLSVALVPIGLVLLFFAWRRHSPAGR